MIKKNIFFFEQITCFNIFFVIILKFFLFKIYYRTLSIPFQKERIINILRLANINWLQYKEKDFFKEIHKNYINETSEKYEIFIKKISNFAIYKKIINLLNIKKKNLNNFNYLLGNFFLGDLVFGSISNVILLQKKFPINAFNIIYFPSTLENYVSIKFFKEKVYLVGFYLFFIELIKITKILIKSLFEKNLFNKYKSKILYIPHNGLKYGNIYKKNFIFKNYKKKIFSNLDILVLDNCVNEIEKRYYKLNKINFSAYPNSQKINLQIYVHLFHFIEKNNFLLKYLLLKLTNIIFNYKLFLKKNSTLKCAFFFYDINADLNFVFSCSLLNIETVSMQERTVGFNWKYVMFYDHYFVSGKDYIKLTSQNKFFFKKIYVLGLIRSALLKKNNNKKISKVLIFDVPNIDFYTSKIWGDFSSIKKRIYLYSGILKLASKNPGIKFLIKPKIAENFNDHLFLSLKKKIDKSNLKNLNFVDNFDKINTYDLVNKYDLVIGSYSSIFDELFSLEKKILIYDKNFSHFVHPLTDTSIHCKSFSQLNMQFNSLKNNKTKTDINLDRIRNNYFYYGKNTNYNFIIKIINKIIK